MPAKFLAAHCTITWHGVDDTTPPGHSIAIGTDSLGSKYVWLFKGDHPTDEAFVGSILVPTRAGQTPTAYGPGGGYAGNAPDTTAALARLAERASKEAT
jgi:hypothetical protein